MPTQSIVDVWSHEFEYEHPTDQLTAVIASAFRHPAAPSNSPPVCGSLVLYTLHIESICHPRAFKSPTSLAPVILDILSRLASNPKDLQEIQNRFDEGTCTCDCNAHPTMREYHAGFGDCKAQFKSTLSHMFNLAARLFIQLRPSNPHLISPCVACCYGLKRKRGDREAAWLRDVSTLLPNGPESLIRMTTFWIKFLDEGGPLFLFTALARICLSLYRAWGPEMRELVEMIISLLKSLSQGLVAERLNPSRPADPYTRHSGPACYPKIQIAITWECLSEIQAQLGPILFPNNPSAFLRQYGQEVLRIFTNMQYETNNPPPLERGACDCTDIFLREILPAWCADIYALEIDEDGKSGWDVQVETPSMRKYLKERKGMQKRLRKTASDWRFVGWAVEGLKESTECRNKGCRATAESIRKPLQHCGGCKIVRYCSKECQKAAWRAPGELNHKSACSLLRSCLGFAYSSFHGMSRREWLNRRDENGLSEEDVKVVIRYLAALLGHGGESLSQFYHRTYLGCSTARSGPESDSWVSDRLRTYLFTFRCRALPHATE